MPFLIIAHGVSVSLPPSRTSASTTRGSDLPTIRYTHVSIPANAAKSIASGSCALVTEKCLPSSRSVSGIPTLKGAANAELMPGIILYLTFAARRAAISSLTRAKTDGHPPLSRATTRPGDAVASRTNVSDISFCVHDFESPPRLPTAIRIVPGFERERTSSADPPKSSYMTTSHASSARAAASVNASAPPGPAPINTTDAPSPRLDAIVPCRVRTAR
mmetsp:Transcript_3041/g.10256  ORF Transcript_3041/g.10256 Transcript_3041/m.10256 type:complete len:218 (+) Transcript_3041:201-854(+)